MFDIERLFFAIGVTVTIFGIAGFVFWLVHHIVFTFDNLRECHKSLEREMNMKITTLFQVTRELQKKLEQERKED